MEIRNYVENIKRVEAISREPNFQEVLASTLRQKNIDRDDVHIVEATAISRDDYLFTFSIKSTKTRVKVRGSFNEKTKSVTIKRYEDVVNPSLQSIKEP